ncbi:hypothetical protein FSARC_11127 [Fusarium sarcochroum]|uniref:Chitin-binding type-1 domain-containing protein n=1 Tax=Fusarium sarcochroum TaxID=1208366 RepID=A0A8H4THD3_9HYPO|nr:hypothetical protein FSARC_11127 [Fusarium sarcochroum]
MPSQRRGLSHYTKVAAGALSLIPLSTLASPASRGKKVFSHYMVGDSTAQHRQKDIKDAKAVGIDGFSLNIGKPNPDFVRSTMNDMFDFAAGQDFGLHISMDVWAAGDVPDKKGVPDYKSLFVDFLGHAAYERGSNGFPMVTTFADGGTNNKTWEDWRDQFANEVFLIPNLDGIPGYWEWNEGWWEHRGNVVDGLFTWESAWPLRKGVGGAFPGDIAPDLPLMKGCEANDKKYMIPLSPLQYKDSYGANLYRAGDVNLPIRMQNILSHRDDIHYVNIMTWNDGPESHYIGDVWPEQNDAPTPAHYMTLPHKGWLPLIGSFNTAFKGDGVMKPHGGETVTGAFWYKSILSDTKCTASAKAVGIEEKYMSKPEFYDTARDLGTYAIVLPQGASGWSLKVSSGGKADTITGLKGGLNYGNTGLRAGAQSIQVIDSSGKVVATAGGGRCVYGGDACPDCIYNVNPNVVQFTSGNLPASSKCDEKCKAKEGGGSGDWGETTKDGKCGKDHGNTNCIGSELGSCCSADGECGMSNAHCGTGCQLPAGYCFQGKEKQTVGGDDDDHGLVSKDDPDAMWPPYLKDAICNIDFCTTDPTLLTKRWIQSGAATWFNNYMDQHSVEGWATKFFTRVKNATTINYNCATVNSPNCRIPEDEDCPDYFPPSAYYVHYQMGSLYDGLNQIWSNMLDESVGKLTTKIPDIVKAYGTPEEDTNALILNMFVGVLTSLAGISGGIKDVVPNNPLGKFVNPLTAVSGVFAQAAAADGSVEGLSPEDLEKSLDENWGKMFTAVMNSIKVTLNAVFNGKLPNGWEKEITPENYVKMWLLEGDWMNVAVINEMVDLYVNNTQDRFAEFATVRAMKSRNKENYSLLVAPRSCISEEKCKTFDGAYFYKDHCLAFGWQAIARMTPIISVRFESKDLTELRHYFPDMNGGLVNNFDCAPYAREHPEECYGGSGFNGRPEECAELPEPQIPTHDDLNIKNPMKYPRCFFNLPTIQWQQCK